MPQAKYKLEDFLAITGVADQDFVHTLHEMLREKGYKSKIQHSKSYGLHISYWQPKIKSVIGIIAYLLVQNAALKVRINADYHAAYQDVLDDLPEEMLRQIAQADDCMKARDPQKCWQGCIGYDFHVRETHYQKCRNNCFLLDVNATSAPSIRKLITRECAARAKFM